VRVVSDKLEALRLAIHPFIAEEGDDLAELLFTELEPNEREGWSKALEERREQTNALRGAWDELAGAVERLVAERDEARQDIKAIADYVASIKAKVKP
jgi:hypothetical protein